MSEELKTYKPESTWARSTLVIILFAVLLAAAIVFRMAVGEGIPRLDSGSIDWHEFRAFLELRFYRLGKCFVIGVGLAVSGVLLQSMLRNPLASPYLLGLSSGAALGVIFGQFLLYKSVITFDPTLTNGTFAILGSLTTIAIVYIAAQKRGWIDPIGLILVGVIVNSINGALIMFVQYLAPSGLQLNFIKWTMGVLNEDDNILLPAAIVVGICWVLSIILARALDVATLPDDDAHGLGLHLNRMRLLVFTLACTMTGATLILAGPIGFVGLICPHIVRILTGPKHRPLVIASGLAGAALVITADATAKYLEVLEYFNTLLPIGVFTALVGGPGFIILLRSRFHRGGVA